MTCHGNHFFDLWQWCNYCLESGPLNFRVFIHAYSLRQRYFVANTRTKLACSRRSDSRARRSVGSELSPPSFFFFFVNFSPALYYVNAWNRLLSLRKITSGNPSGKTIPWRKTFCFDVGQSDQTIEYSSSDSSRPRALACLGFWGELPNTLWNVNFTTITRFPATLACSRRSDSKAREKNSRRKRNEERLLRRWMLTSLWSNYFLNYVCDVGFRFRFIKCCNM